MLEKKQGKGRNLNSLFEFRLLAATKQSAMDLWCNYKCDVFPNSDIKIHFLVKKLVLIRSV